MMAKKENARLSNYSIFVIVSFIVLFLGVIIINEYDYYSAKRSVTNSISWEKRYETSGIKSVRIKLDTLFFKISKKQLRCWKKVKKVYVNENIIKFESLYKWQDFIYKHCEEYYIILPVSEIDSIVYDFSKNVYKEYDSEKKLINSSDFFNSKRKYHKKYKNALPECKESIGKKNIK